MCACACACVCVVTVCVVLGVCVCVKERERVCVCAQIATSHQSMNHRYTGGASIMNIDVCEYKAVPSYTHAVVYHIFVCVCCFCLFWLLFFWGSGSWNPLSQTSRPPSRTMCNCLLLVRTIMPPPLPLSSLYRTMCVSCYTSFHRVPADCDCRRVLGRCAVLFARGHQAPRLT